MKKTIQTSLAVIAISTSACASLTPAAARHEGRIIQFTSGSEGFDTSTFFYEGAREVVAFDAQFTPALAKQSIEHLRKYTDKPISWLVITHPNPDKFNGASVFRDVGAKIISSAATASEIPVAQAYKEYYFVEMAKMFKRREYPQPVPVDRVFTGTLDITLQGGEKIHLRELNKPGVSTTQTVAFLPQVESLIVGDLVHHKAHAWLEGGIVQGKPTPTLAGWIQDLEQIAELFPAETLIYGGRGEVGQLSVVIQEQKAYLQTADRVVTSYVQELGSRKNELQTAEAGKHYAEIQRRLEAQYPAYKLGYMIQYGVYGLVNSK